MPISKTTILGVLSIIAGIVLLSLRSKVKPADDSKQEKNKAENTKAAMLIIGILSIVIPLILFAIFYDSILREIKTRKLD